MAACGAFALAGFPLDDMWHRLFGQDVTLWGPTHLMLIGGAGMTLIGQAVLLRRASAPAARPRAAHAPRAAGALAMLRQVALMGGLLIGLSTFQAEFDFGVPQFRAVLQPALIAFAAGVALVAARVWIGRGGALGAALFFLAVRGVVSLLVGPVLGETTPSLPLYLVEALAVEAAAVALAPPRPARGRRGGRPAGRHGRLRSGVGLDPRGLPAPLGGAAAAGGPRARRRRRDLRRPARRADRAGAARRAPAPGG